MPGAEIADVVAGAPPSGQALERRWLPALSILAVMLGLPITGAAATAALSSTPVPPVIVADRVEVSLPPEWVFVERQGRRGEVVILSNGTANLAVIVDDTAGSAASRLTSYVAWMEADATSLVVGAQVPFEIDAQRTAVRVPYLAVIDGLAYTVEGEVTAVALPSGGTVIFDGWASEGSYGVSREQVDSIIRTSVLDR